MDYGMDLLTVHEPYLLPATTAPHEDDFSWLILDPLFDNWAGWLNPVHPDHNAAAANNPSRPTSPLLPLPQPAPVLLPVPPIAEDYADLFGSTPPAAANPCCHAASKSEKRLRPREITMVLRSWLERRHAPYASLEEKKMIAEALFISVEKVTNFCNNFRKRYAKVGTKQTSYRELASAAQ